MSWGLDSRVVVCMLLKGTVINIDELVQINFHVSCCCCFSPTTPSAELLRVTVTSSETDEKNATFKVVTKVRSKPTIKYLKPTINHLIKEPFISSILIFRLFFIFYFYLDYSRKL